jgi:dUTP pyrophosphatase
MSGDVCETTDLPLKEVAARLRTQVPTVRKWVRTGRLPGTRLPNGEWRVPRSAVESFPTTRRGGQKFGSTRGVLLFCRGKDCHSLPTKGHPDDAGYDLYAAESRTITPQEVVRVRTGVRVAVPPGHVAVVHDRSSMASKGLLVGGGIIDPGYTGEVDVIVVNTSDRAKQVHRGDKVAQLLVYRLFAGEVDEASDLAPTDRGAKGFGSTGK